MSQDNGAGAKSCQLSAGQRSSTLQKGACQLWAPALALWLFHRLLPGLASGLPDLVQQLKVKRGMRPDEVVKPLSALHLESRCLVHEQDPGASSGQALWSRADSWWLPRARTDMTYPMPLGNYPELSSLPPILLCCFLREGLGISHQ